MCEYDCVHVNVSARMRKGVSECLSKSVSVKLMALCGSECVGVSVWECVFVVQL